MRTELLPLFVLICLVGVSSDAWIDVQGRVVEEYGREHEVCSVDLGEAGYGIERRIEGADFHVEFSTGPADRDFEVTVKCEGASGPSSTTQRPRSVSSRSTG